MAKRRLAASAFQDKFAGLLLENGPEMIGEDVDDVGLVSPDSWEFKRSLKNLFLPNHDRLTHCMKINQGSKSDITIGFVPGTDQVNSMCFDEVDIPQSEIDKIHAWESSPKDDNLPEP